MATSRMTAAVAGASPTRRKTGATRVRKTPSSWDCRKYGSCPIVKVAVEPTDQDARVLDHVGFDRHPVPASDMHASDHDWN